MNLFKKILAFFSSPEKTYTVSEGSLDSVQEISEPEISAQKNITKESEGHQKEQPIHPFTNSVHINNIKLPDKIKLVFTGSIGAGKTTAIRAVSEKEIISTEAKPTDSVKEMKSTTTTSMDYGSFLHHSGSSINVFGTPGQRRFSFMSEILTEGADGLIILINNNQENPLEDLDHYLQNNEKFLSRHQAVIAITHYDTHNTHNISIYSDYMAERGMKWPVMSIDARKKSDILHGIEQIIDAEFSPKFK
mgnify:CR=1 FL=1